MLITEDDVSRSGEVKSKLLWAPLPTYRRLDHDAGNRELCSYLINLNVILEPMYMTLAACCLMQINSKANGRSSLLSQECLAFRLVSFTGFIEATLFVIWIIASHISKLTAIA